jgi:hypothetical protein
MGILLTVKNLSKSFGGLLALKEITLKVAPEQIVGIIGPNGAGKTTFFNCLSCLYHPTGGKITFDKIPLATSVSKTVKQRVRILAMVFLATGFHSAPPFLVLFPARNLFQGGGILLGVLSFSFAFLLVRGLLRHEIWAWGLMFIFLLSDVCFALLCFSPMEPFQYRSADPVTASLYCRPMGGGGRAFQSLFHGVFVHTKRPQALWIQNRSGCGLPYGDGQNISKHTPFFQPERVGQRQNRPARPHALRPGQHPL